MLCRVVLPRKYSGFLPFRLLSLLLLLGSHILYTQFHSCISFHSFIRFHVSVIRLNSRISSLIDRPPLLHPSNSPIQRNRAAVSIRLCNRSSISNLAVALALNSPRMSSFNSQLTEFNLCL